MLFTNTHQDEHDIQVGKTSQNNAPFQIELLLENIWLLCLGDF